MDFGLIVNGKPVEASPQPEIVQQAPVQTAQTVTTTRVDTAESVYLLKPVPQWTWQDLRDYVITEAEKRSGPQIRNLAKESGIFKGFIGRYGIESAVMIAIAAYEIYEGIWRSAPIGVTRFTKGNDPYFSDVILATMKG